MGISVQENPELFYILDGWLAPSKDKETYNFSLQEAELLRIPIQYCTGLRTVIQAGGNIGVFPRILADVFQTVYTVEPDELNFLAVQHNTAMCQNVHALRAAFGYDRIKGSVVESIPGNASAYQVVPGDEFDVIRVDDLNVQDCDLLLLDVEGYEYFAVQGAMETIERSSPVICLEMKKFFVKKYRVLIKDIYRLMSEIGYVEKKVIESRDHVFVRR